MNATELLLLLAGVAQLGILGASLAVPVVFRWRTELASLSPFLRRLFWVYGAFIFMTVLAMGLITLLNAAALAQGTALARGFCLFAGVFWLVRLGVQLFVFDCSDYLRTRLLRIGYHALTPVFAALAGSYLWMAFGAGG